MLGFKFFFGSEFFKAADFFLWFVTKREQEQLHLHETWLAGYSWLLGNVEEKGMSEHALL